MFVINPVALTFIHFEKYNISQKPFLLEILSDGVEPYSNQPLSSE
jgi:hypothetical protein